MTLKTLSIVCVCVCKAHVTRPWFLIWIPWGAVDKAPYSVFVRSTLMNNSWRLGASLLQAYYQTPNAPSPVPPASSFTAPSDSTMPPTSANLRDNTYHCASQNIQYSYTYKNHRPVSQTFGSRIHCVKSRGCRTYRSRTPPSVAAWWHHSPRRESDRKRGR